MNKESKITVFGGTGLVGSALLRKLHSDGYTNLSAPTSERLDLMNQMSVNIHLGMTKPDYVFLAAAKVGGIHANDKFPAEFIHNNLVIQTNVINACREAGVKKLMFLGSVCIYPKYAQVPVREESLLSGELEPTNQWYAVAKIAGIKMCQAYRKQYGCNFVSVMPCNLYGVNDNFHPLNSHVIPALIRRFVDAKEKNLEIVTCWGTGQARREFMYVDDMADACVFLMNTYDEGEIINIGYGDDYTIREVVETIAELVGYRGHIIWDHEKPDGTPKRMLDTTKLFGLGWKPKVGLREGLTKAIDWYKLHKHELD